MQGWKAFLFPKLRRIAEFFGWLSIEPQACGCPVTASDIPLLAEVLGNSVAIHSLDDEDGLAEFIRRLAANGKFRDQVRQTGFANVLTRF